jgi:hypothetical protein
MLYSQMDVGTLANEGGWQMKNQSLMVLPIVKEE